MQWWHREPLHWPGTCCGKCFIPEVWVAVPRSPEAWHTCLLDWNLAFSWALHRDGCDLWKKAQVGLLEHMRVQWKWHVHPHLQVGKPSSMLSERCGNGHPTCFPTPPAFPSWAWAIKRSCKKKSKNHKLPAAPSHELGLLGFFLFWEQESAAKIFIWETKRSTTFCISATTL